MQRWIEHRPLLADCFRLCNTNGSEGDKMIHAGMNRRAMLGAGAAAAAAMTIPISRVLAQAAAETGDLRAVVNVLASDPKDRLARALASLGRAFMARDS